MAVTSADRWFGIGQYRLVPRPLLSAFRWLRMHVSDEWLIVIVALALSITFYIWYDGHGWTHKFIDSQVRELTGRRVLVSRTPGLAQLGYTWLPLTSVFMLPLIWNDTLFREGIASSAPSMAAFVLAAMYMYRIGRLATGSRGAGWVASAVLVLNPSLLYMQSTAMSETLSLSAFIIAIYYALRLAKSGAALDIVKCATAVAVGTLIRYENWALAIVLVPVIAYAAWRRRGYVLVEAWVILYAVLAFAGCVAWVLYNAAIFHDPLLSFFYGQSSHTYYANTPDAALPARHHALVAAQMYGFTVLGTVGWLLAITGVLGLFVFLWRARLRVRLLPAYLVLLPFALYWLILYRGVNTENLPELGDTYYYNIRFGLLMIPAVALLTAFLVSAAPRVLRRVAVGAGLAAVVVAMVLGSINTPYVVREALYGVGSGVEAAGDSEAQWFSTHYRGGSVLITYLNNSEMIFSLLTKHNFADLNFVTDANTLQYEAALKHPEKSVTWVVMNSDLSNGAESRIWTTLHGRDDWLRYFVKRDQLGTTEIYERVATPLAAVASVK